MDDLSFYTEIRNLRKQYGPVENWEQLFRVGQEVNIPRDEMRRLQSIKGDLSGYERGAVFDYLYTNNVQLNLQTVEILNYFVPFEPLSPAMGAIVEEKRSGPFRFIKTISRDERYLKKQIKFNDSQEILISALYQNELDKIRISTLKVLDNYLLGYRLFAYDEYLDVYDGHGRTEGSISTLKKINEKVQYNDCPEGYKDVFQYLTFISSLSISRYDNFERIVNPYSDNEEDNEVTMMSLSSKKRECNPDGCDRVPDFQGAASCCNDHDILYCKGGPNEEGSEYSRWVSDSEFYHCLNSNTDAAIAYSFYSGVRRYGANHFNYFASPWSDRLENESQSGNIEISIVVDKVEYFGGNIGGDTSVYGVFRVDNSETSGKVDSGIVELSSNISNVTSKTINKTVLEETLPSGTSIFGFSIFGGAVERDFGVVNNNDKHFWSLNNYYGNGNERLEPGHKWGDSMNILITEEPWGTAVFRFLFTVEIDRAGVVA